MINGVHHPSLTTAHFDRMMTFYTELLGFESVHQNHIKKSASIDVLLGESGATFRLAILRTGTGFLEVMETRERAGGPGEASAQAAHSAVGYRHIALDVTDIDAEYQRLSRAGVRFTSPPQTFANVKAAYAHDPDGNVIELMEVMTETFPFHMRRGGKLIAGWTEDFDVQEAEAQEKLLKAAVAGDAVS